MKKKVYLPKNLDPKKDKIPTVLYQTRYVKSLELKGFFKILKKYATTNIRMEDIQTFIKN